MSANSPFTPQNPRTRTNLAAAAPTFDINQFLANLPPNQRAPTRANHDQSTQTMPNPAPAQNKPTLRPPILDTLRNPPLSPILRTPSSSPHVPNSPKARQDQPYFQTKPIKPNRSPRPLTPNQLRAASLLVAGQSTNSIAATLKINRHTLAHWKRHPYFQQELRRLIHTPIARR